MSDMSHLADLAELLREVVAHLERIEQVVLKSGTCRAGQASDPDGLWTADQTAAFLACSKSSVYGKAESGELPCLRVGGLLRFDPGEVRKWARGEVPLRGAVLPLRPRKP